MHPHPLILYQEDHRGRRVPGASGEVQEGSPGRQQDCSGDRADGIVVEYTVTKPRHPQTNGCVERFDQTVQEEFYKVVLRKKLNENLD